MARLAPLVNVVETLLSTRRTSSPAGEPLKFVTGIKRNFAVVESRSADESLTLDTGYQLEPPVEYSHVP